MLLYHTHNEDYGIFTVVESIMFLGNKQHELAQQDQLRIEGNNLPNHYVQDRQKF
jgi:hypothetical protein